jgi:hypothetical protein
MSASSVSDKEVEMTTLHHDPELYEPVSRADFYDLQAEIAELHERLDALLEAVEIIAHDHYRPLRLEGRVTGALHRARRRLAIYAADLRK